MKRLASFLFTGFMAIHLGWRQCHVDALKPILDIVQLVASFDAPV